MRVMIEQGIMVIVIVNMLAIHVSGNSCADDTEMYSGQAFNLLEAISVEDIHTKVGYTNINLTWKPSSVDGVNYGVQCGSDQEWFNTTKAAADCSYDHSPVYAHISLRVQKCRYYSRDTTLYRETVIYPVEKVIHTASTHDTIFVAWLPSKSHQIFYKVRCDASKHYNITSFAHFRCENLNSESENQIEITVAHVRIENDSIPYILKAWTKSNRSHFYSRKHKLKSCTQSSTNSLPCESAIDGNKKTCSVTRKKPVPSYWRGEFIQSIWLKNIVLYAADNLLESRLHNIYVVTDDGICNFFSNSTLSVFNINCDVVTRSLEVRHFGNRSGDDEFLTICEIEAFAYNFYAIPSSNITLTSNFENVDIKWEKSPFDGPYDGVSYIIDCGTNAGSIEISDNYYNCTNGLVSGNEYNMSLTVKKSTLKNVTHFSVRTRLYPVESLNITNVSTSSIRLIWKPSKTQGVLYALHCSKNQQLNLTNTEGTCTDLEVGITYEISIVVTKPNFPDSDRRVEYAKTILPAIPIQDINTTSNYTSVRVTWQRSQIDGATYAIDCGLGRINITSATSYTCDDLESGQNIQITLEVSKNEATSNTSFTARTDLYDISHKTFNATTTARSIEVKWSPSIAKGVTYTLNCSDQQQNDLIEPSGTCVNLTPSTKYKVSVTVRKDGFGSKISLPIEAVTNPEAPIAKFQDIQRNSAKLWIESVGNKDTKFIFTLASSYNIRIHDNITVVNGTWSYLFQNLHPSTTYNVTLKAVCYNVESQKTYLELTTLEENIEKSPVIQLVFIPLATILAVVGAVILASRLRLQKEIYGKGRSKHLHKFSYESNTENWNRR